MCNLSKFISRATGLPYAGDTAKADAASAQQLREQQARLADQARVSQEALTGSLNRQNELSAEANAAQQAALEQAAKAAETAGTGDDAARATEARLRRLRGRRGLSATVLTRPDALGAAPVATRQLLGA